VTVAQSGFWAIRTTLNEGCDNSFLGIALADGPVSRPLRCRKLLMPTSPESDPSAARPDPTEPPPDPSGVDGDVVRLLTRQHRQLEALLKSTLDAESMAERRTHLERACDELAVHLGAEETVFYPAVRAARTREILLESLEEHLSLKRLVADLLDMPIDDETFIAKCKVLREQAEHHHREEEEHLFPKVQTLIDPAARGALRAAVQAHEVDMRAAGSPRLVLKRQTRTAEPLR
jgi:iron-sulfur cluster repair protein YtfE (RIC family)